MISPEKIPVIAGIGQVLQRMDDPLQADEPIQMMVAALEKAGDDAGAPRLPGQADSIYVPRGITDYGDPGREISRRLGAIPVETVSTPIGGNFAQSCVIDAARQIHASRHNVILIAGAENGRSRVQAERRGIEVIYSEAPGRPGRMLGDNKPMVHEAERVRGITNASHMYAIIESAIRYARGETIQQNVERISSLWARFNAIACDNPNAWIRKPYTGQEIGQASPNNPMISFPYTRLMNANPRVDMAAGLILCSLETARKAGVPDEKLVFVHAATEANDSQFASTRAEFHRSPAMRLCGNRILELAGKAVKEIDYIDLYSCFPSAVQVAATELGIPQDRDLTVTGGLTFGGGPLNTYVLHAVARMVEVLREDRGSTGLVSGNGGWLAKHSFGVYSTEPSEHGFRYENLQEKVDAFPLREAIIDWKGPVTIEGYTVAYQADDLRIGYVACLLDNGSRTWGVVQDRSVLQTMVSEEFCGRIGRLDGHGNLGL